MVATVDWMDGAQIFILIKCSCLQILFVNLDNNNKDNMVYSGSLSHNLVPKPFLTSIQINSSKGYTVWVESYNPLPDRFAKIHVGSSKTVSATHYL